MLKLRSILKQSSVGRALSEIFVGGAAQGSTDRGGDEGCPTPASPFSAAAEGAFSWVGVAAARRIGITDDYSERKGEAICMSMNICLCACFQRAKPTSFISSTWNWRCNSPLAKSTTPFKTRVNNPSHPPALHKPIPSAPNNELQNFFFSPHSPFCPWGWEHSNGVAQGT